MDSLSFLQTAKIIPVITIDDIDHALPLAEALYENGIKIIEITLRTNIAIDAIKMVKQHFSNNLVAAGTVLNEVQLHAAIGAGADLIVSPGATTTMLSAVSETNVPFLPGIATCTEIATALEYDHNYLKFFPANLAGGIEALKVFSAVFPNVMFCPTGGINQNNVHDYLSLNNVICVGGSWLTPKDLIKQKAWDKIGKIVHGALSV